MPAFEFILILFAAFASGAAVASFAVAISDDHERARSRRFRRMLAR